MPEQRTSDAIRRIVQSNPPNKIIEKLTEFVIEERREAFRTALEFAKLKYLTYYPKRKK